MVLRESPPQFSYYLTLGRGLASLVTVLQGGFFAAPLPIPTTHAPTTKLLPLDK